MTRSKTQYVCQQCGRAAAKPLGRCPQCGAWNSMLAETVAPPAARRRSIGATPGAQPVQLSQIEGQADERLPLPIEEFARVLGGGVVPASVVLVGGEPGIGKSTLLLQMAVRMAAAGPVAVRLRRGVGAADQAAGGAPVRRRNRLREPVPADGNRSGGDPGHGAARSARG